MHTSVCTRVLAVKLQDTLKSEYMTQTAIQLSLIKLQHPVQFKISKREDLYFGVF